MNLQTPELDIKCQPLSVLCTHACLSSLPVSKGFLTLSCFFFQSHKQIETIVSWMVELHLYYWRVEELLCFSCPGVIFAEVKWSCFAIFGWLIGKSFSSWCWATCSSPMSAPEIWKRWCTLGERKEPAEAFPFSCSANVFAGHNCWCTRLPPTSQQTVHSMEWFSRSKQCRGKQARHLLTLGMEAASFPIDLRSPERLQSELCPLVGSRPSEQRWLASHTY